jgi:hypothetical protein
MPAATEALSNVETLEGFVKRRETDWSLKLSAPKQGKQEGKRVSL